MILLIGSGNDPHLKSIQGHIRERGCQAEILDIDKASLLNTEFNYDSVGNIFHINQKDILFNSEVISSVFCFNPLYAKKGFVSNQQTEFWHTTWRESLYGYYAALSDKTFFVNKGIYTSLFAQNKIHFFQAARLANVLTPKTLFSNNRNHIIKFCSECSDNIVLKTMHQIYLEYNGEQTMMLVKKVKASDFDTFNSENECPVFLQELIQKKFDLRVIIVGDKVFSCKIDASQSETGNLDWRTYDLPKTIHTEFDISKDIKEKLINCISFFNLDYACLDLCVDQDDKFWLLDINPFGRYMWIEMAIDLPISKAIADFLISKRRLR